MRFDEGGPRRKGGANGLRAKCRGCGLCCLPRDRHETGISSQALHPNPKHPKSAELRRISPKPHTWTPHAGTAGGREVGRYTRNYRYLRTCSTMPSEWRGGSLPAYTVEVSSPRNLRLLTWMSFQADSTSAKQGSFHP